MMKRLLASALGAAGIFSVAPAAMAADVNVGLELVLLVDVSGSVDNGEYALQKSGYVQAFQSAAVQAAILGSQLGSIAVTYVEWSGAGQQSQKVGWTLIDSAATANAFATAIQGVTRAFDGATAIQDAIRYGTGLFGTETGSATSNGYASLRQVIDVSGDGACNDGNCAVANGAAITAGVDTINGLPILGEGGLQAYYQNNVVAGGGFIEIAAGFGDFADAIQRKLVKEISNVPEPATLALVGLGLLGAGAARRRASKQA